MKVVEITLEEWCDRGNLDTLIGMLEKKGLDIQKPYKRIEAFFPEKLVFEQED